MNASILKASENKFPKFEGRMHNFCDLYLLFVLVFFPLETIFEVLY